jgi:hypothetical protein
MSSKWPGWNTEVQNWVPLPFDNMNLQFRFGEAKSLKKCIPPEVTSLCNKGYV